MERGPADEQNTSAWRAGLEILIRQQALPEEKYGHQPRLYALTVQLGAGLQYDDDVVFAAAWLHDLGVFQGHRPDDLNALAKWDSVAYALRHTPEILRKLRFPEGKVTQVLECIGTHQPQHSPQSTEATLLRDADILEQLGAVGILRTVCKVGRDTRFPTFTYAVQSLRTAHQTLPGLLRLPQSRLLASDRIEVLAQWLAAVQTDAGAMLF